MDNVSANGKLDNDGIVRALHTYRNTPDPGCKLSPAEILLGRQLRDTLPIIRKDIMSFNNPQINGQWRDLWKAKEDALKTRYVKTIEDMSEHTRSLPTLRHGDCVRIQNQQGRFPKKWDKSGKIVETKENDQYVVKVVGSGRLTLRNRRFLRKHDQHALSQPGPVLPRDSTTELSPTMPAVTATPLQPANVTPHLTPYLPPGPPAFLSPCSGDQHGRTPYPDASDVGAPTARPITSPSSRATLAPRRVIFGDAPSDETLPPQGTNPAMLPQPARPTRSTRTKTQSKVYDASSGTYAEPTPVPEDV